MLLRREKRTDKYHFERTEKETDRKGTPFAYVDITREKVGKNISELVGSQSEDIHKGDMGKVLLCAGSEGMCGAAVIATRSALRCGSGLVQVAIKRELFPIIQTGIPEATCVNLERILSYEKENDLNNKNGFELKVYDAACIGPGIGTSVEAKLALEKLISLFNGPLVIDADGLNLVAANDLFMEVKTRALLGLETVLLPHQGEALRLLKAGGVSDAQLGKMSREEMAMKLYEFTEAVTVLKGHETLVYDGNILYKNTTGNRGMATAGSGDCLSGVVLSLLGQGMKAKDAAISGVFIHGLAGDFAEKKLGFRSVMASDISEALSEAFFNIY